MPLGDLSTGVGPDNDQLTIVPPPADGSFVAAVLDLGQYRTGHFMLDVADAAGDEIIDILYAEALDKGDRTSFPLIVGEMNRREGCEEATASRYRFVPPGGEGTLQLPTGTTCVVSYSATALRVPTTDVNAGAPNVQTNQVASSTATTPWQRPSSTRSRVTKRRSLNFARSITA